jgi:predicted transposase
MFVGLQFKLELKRKDRENLIKLMRKQSSAIRVAYNMLKELEKEKTKNPHAQIYQRLRQLFPELPTKYIDSAFLYNLTPLLLPLVIWNNPLITLDPNHGYFFDYLLKVFNKQGSV